MAWLKRQLIDEAFAELTLQGFEFDTTAEEQQTALRRLDAMMATWEGRGIRLGYALPSSPDASDLDQDSGIPDTAAEAVFLALAVRIAPGFGKQVPTLTLTNARNAFEPLQFAAARPQAQPMPSTMPLGAGNKGLRRTGGAFFPTPSNDQLPVGAGGDLDILKG